MPFDSKNTIQSDGFQQHESLPWNFSKRSIVSSTQHCLSVSINETSGPSGTSGSRCGSLDMLKHPELLSAFHTSVADTINLKRIVRSHWIRGFFIFFFYFSLFHFEKFFLQPRLFLVTVFLFNLKLEIRKYSIFIPYCWDSFITRLLCNYRFSLVCSWLSNHSRRASAEWNEGLPCNLSRP